MVRTLIATSLVAALPTLAQAGSYELFTCHTQEQGADVTIRFGVRHLENAKRAELVAVNANADEEGPIEVTSPGNKHPEYLSLEQLNGQGGDLRMGPQKLVLWGDGAGCVFVTFTLYKDSGYTKGGVEVREHCANPETKWYAPVHCTHETARD